MEELTDEAIRKLVSDCFDELEKNINVFPLQECLANTHALGSCPASATFNSLTSVNMMVEDDAGDSGLLDTITQARVRPAADSGACDHAINPGELPDDAVITPNATGKHFKGANDIVVEKYGDVDTVLGSDLGAISCGWKAANASRPPHSISRIVGPPGGLDDWKQTFSATMMSAGSCRPASWTSSCPR